MFALKEFRKMKPTAVIINTARGGIIDEQALHQALVEGAIAGAGLDVTNPEPPRPDNPLLKLEQVLITGHSAFFSDASSLEIQQKAAEAGSQPLKGECLLSVNPSKRSKESAHPLNKNRQQEEKE
jgi:D-3-phosphoglycerate dehydrogenase